MTSNDSAVTVIIFFWNAVNSSINLPAFRVQTFADFKNLVTYVVFNLIHDYPPSVAVNTKWYWGSFLAGRVLASWTYRQKYSLVLKESAPNINGKYERLKQRWVYIIFSSTLIPSTLTTTYFILVSICICLMRWFSLKAIIYFCFKPISEYIEISDLKYIELILGSRISIFISFNCYFDGIVTN